MIILRAERTLDGGPALAAIQSLSQRFPGRHGLQVHVGTSRLTLGPAWRYAACEGLLVALSEFGEVRVAP